ncbi:MAG: hypothetical protein ACKVOM_12390 [Ferruginibacter sp.]
MKTILLLLAVITLASCSTIYKSGQTPDDLYYAKPKEAVAVKKSNRYERLDNVYEERQIRMAVYDYRWRSLDARYDYDYTYSPYNYGYNYGYYYNPYYCSYPVYGQSVVFVNPKNTTIRKSNLASYNNTITTTYTVPKGANNTGTRTVIRGYNNSNNQPVRNNTYNNPVYNGARSYSDAPANGNSNTGGSAPASTGSSISRPTRGQ